MTAATLTIHSEKSKKSKPKSKSKAGLPLGAKIRAGAFFALAGAGLAVSLPHLASEVALLTGAGTLSAWFTALVIDLGLCATKAHLSANGPKQSIAWTVVVACTALSVALNCHAFLTHATGGFGQVAAVGFGCFIPLFVVAMSFLASETVLRHK